MTRRFPEMRVRFCEVSGGCGGASEVFVRCMEVCGGAPEVAEVTAIGGRNEPGLLWLRSVGAEVGADFMHFSSGQIRFAFMLGAGRVSVYCCWPGAIRFDAGLIRFAFLMRNLMFGPFGDPGRRLENVGECWLNVGRLLAHDCASERIWARLARLVAIMGYVCACGRRCA